jgi:hypothetical protein
MCTAKFAILARGEYDSKKLRGVGHDLLTLVLVDRDTGLPKQLLVEGEIDGDLAYICQSKRALLAATNNDVTEVTDIGAEIDVLKVYGDAVDLHLSHALRIRILT